MAPSNQTLQEIYQTIVTTLPLNERLRLAALILNDLTQQHVEMVDTQPTWTTQDQLELVSFSLYAANTLSPDDEGLV